MFQMKMGSKFFFISARVNQLPGGLNEVLLAICRTGRPRKCRNHVRSSFMTTQRFSFTLSRSRSRSRSSDSLEANIWSSFIAAATNMSHVTRLWWLFMLPLKYQMFKEVAVKYDLFFNEAKYQRPII